MLNLDQLAAFVCVVDLGSFTAAAEKVGLTQPAVSQQLKLLEQRMGVRLIERVGRRAQPSPAGVELLAHARRILAECASAEEVEVAAQRLFTCFPARSPLPRNACQVWRLSSASGTPTR
jgi:DNA-binding transcriptional LysR family regulator